MIKRSTWQSRATEVENDENDSRTKPIAPSQRAVRVAVRIRPPFESELATGTYEDVVHVSPNQRKVVVSYADHSKEFAFDQNFGPETTQEEVYNDIAAPLVEQVLNGRSCTVMAYGQTGTGKTHTMGLLTRLAPDPSPADGIVSRALHHIFRSRRTTTAPQRVALTFTQLYCDQLFNLLNPNCTGSLVIREDPKRGFYIDGLEEQEVGSVAEAIEVVNYGLEQRYMASTRRNVTSSRSHCTLTVTVFEGDADMGRKLTLIDLAGSERVAVSRSSGVRLDEAKAINKSLSFLGNVVRALAQGKTGGSSESTYVSYRSSKLTTLLHETLAGGAGVGLVATVDMGRSNRSETLSTLAFARRCMAVQVQYTIGKGQGRRKKRTGEEGGEEGDGEEEWERRMAEQAQVHAVREQKLVEFYEQTIQEMEERLKSAQERRREEEEEREEAGMSASVAQYKADEERIAREMSSAPLNVPTTVTTSTPRPVMAYTYKLLADLRTRTLAPIETSLAREQSLCAAHGIAPVLDAQSLPTDAVLPPLDTLDTDASLLSALRTAHGHVAANTHLIARVWERKDARIASLAQALSDLQQQQQESSSPAVVAVARTSPWPQGVPQQPLECTTLSSRVAAASMSGVSARDRVRMLLDESSAV